MSISPFGTQKNFGISDSLLDAVRGVVKGQPEEEQQPVVVEEEEVELEEKKLDPVGQEDDDVDNDGDTDSSDKYLKNRRKAIGKAMKGKKDEVDTDPKLDEEIELTEREDTAMQVARALKKMGVKPNAKEADVIKKIPGVLDKMKLSPGARRLISRDPDFIGDVFDSMNEGLEEEVNPATVNLVMKYGKDDEKARFRRYANMSALRPDEKRDRDKIIAVSRGRAKSAKMEGLEDKTDNPANSQHLCAKQVVHEEWGTGNPIHGEHAEPDADGHIEWYDVMFDHGIEQQVSIDEMKVTKSEAHMNHKKKK